MPRPETERAVAKFLAYFEEIKKLHLETMGRPLEMYKSTDPECLANAFESLWHLEATGVKFVGEMMHVLAWSQCLGNANHRTTALFVGDFLDSAGVEVAFTREGEDPPATAQRLLNSWIDRSQALIRRRGEAGYSQARLEPRHREITREWVEDWIGAQSEALTIIGPHRLMNFIS